MWLLGGNVNMFKTGSIRQFSWDMCRPWFEWEIYLCNIFSLFKGFPWIVLWKCYFLLWCRLFQLSIGISQKKCCQLINSLWQNIIPPWNSMIGHGQVGFWYIYLSALFIGFFMLIIYPVYLYSAVYFLYDLSPITVTIKEERRKFLHFVTRLCAVLGGTFALTGLCFSVSFKSA